MLVSVAAGHHGGCESGGACRKSWRCTGPGCLLYLYLDRNHRYLELTGCCVVPSHRCCLVASLPAPQSLASLKTSSVFSTLFPLFLFPSSRAPHPQTVCVPNSSGPLLLVFIWCPHERHSYSASLLPLSRLHGWPILWWSHKAKPTCALLGSTICHYADCRQGKRVLDTGPHPVTVSCNAEPWDGQTLRPDAAARAWLRGSLCRLAAHPQHL
jgi:hypothetical protein